MSEQQQERVAQYVVTGENREQFMAHKLDLAKPEAPVVAPETIKAEQKAEAKKDEPKVDAKPDEEEKDEEVKEVKKKNPKIEQRFSDLTKARKEAEAKAEAAEKRAAEAAAKAAEKEREASELRAKYEKPAEPKPKPKPEDFQDVAKYGEALEAWTREETTREEGVKRQQEARKTTWMQRVEDAKKDIADYAQVVSQSQVVVSDEVREAIFDSEVGPRILHYLAKNPDQADALGKLSVASALKMLGRIEERVAKPAPKDESKAEPKAEPKKDDDKQTDKRPIAEISKAAPPISTLKGANAPAETPVDEKGEFRGSYAQYKAARQAGKIK